jgi:hypothetical protein
MFRAGFCLGLRMCDTAGMWRNTLRLVAYGALCAGLLLPPWALWAREGFSGEMRLRADGIEGLVVRRAIPDATDAPLLAVPPELLPFVDSASAGKLPGDFLYDAMPLPFLVRLAPSSNWETLTRHRSLVIEEAGAPARFLFKPGEYLEVGGKRLTVDHAHPWVYLQEYEEGWPVALLNLQRVQDGAVAFDETPPEVIAATEQAWRLDGGGRAFRLAFHAYAVAAVEALPARLRWAEDARWGVEDGGAIQWFAGLSIGSGAILEDGTDVTLLSYDYIPGEPPAITVSIATESGVEERRILADAEAGGGVRFEAPACAAEAYLVHALDDERAVIGFYRYGERVDVGTVQQGRWWVPEGGKHALRFEGASRRAVVVDAEQSKRYAMEFDWGGEARRIVESETLVLGDATLRFEPGREQPAADLYCVLSFVDEVGAVFGSAELHADRKPVTLRGWRFAHVLTPEAPDGDFVIAATHLRPVVGKLVIAAGLLSIGGALLAATRPPRRAIDADH